jgi:hypothetical protein
MMRIANTVPSIVQAFSPLLLKSMNFNFRITHSNKTKSKQVKATIKDTNFFGFLINDASKNKVKQNLKQSRGCACETPLAEVFFSPATAPENFVACCGTVDVNHRPVGNPKRKV